MKTLSLLFDGEHAFFAERGEARAASVAIRPPEGGTLLLSGVRLPVKGEVALLPEGLLTVGENRLSLLLDGACIPVEPLLYERGRVRPVGLPTEAIILSQHARITHLQASLAALAARVAALEEKSRAHTLFH